MKKGMKAVMAGGIGAVMLLGLTGCSGTGSGPNSMPSVQKVQPAPMAQPFGALQVASDTYLKQSKQLAISSQEVYDKVVVGGDTSYLLVDVRNDDHYANAHIPGTIHISYADAWREEKVSHLPKDKKIVVIDYSGHAASQIVALWNMLGYDAVAMQNGMAGWSKSGDIIGGSPLACNPLHYPVVTVATGANSHDLPAIETKALALPELVMLQSKTATEKAIVIQATELKDKLSSGAYFVVDLRAPEHYQAGHIAGAVNIPFRLLAETDSLKKIPADKQTVMVCYDGHAASQAVRIVNQLGYNAVAMRDGMSIWTGDTKVIGSPVIACAQVLEHPIAKLNATLKASSGGAAT